MPELGGGLFIASQGAATLNNVTFLNDQAVGGAAGSAAGNGVGGGGGLGGDGGAGATGTGTGSYDGGGGGIGTNAAGGSAVGGSGGVGIVVGAAGGMNGTGNHPAGLSITHKSLTPIEILKAEMLNEIPCDSVSSTEFVDGVRDVGSERWFGALERPRGRWLKDARLGRRFADLLKRLGDEWAARSPSRAKIGRIPKRPTGF